MAPNFSKNAILIGMVDYFCLVCEAYLKSEGDTEVHISKPVHQKHLEIIQYVDEFKEDGIKKIKNKYFCELCNKVLTVLARVRLHVSEQTHYDNKSRYSLKRAGNSIIAFGNVVISDQSWNGLNENSCAICNIEYEEEEIHKNQPAHILNVIQIQTEFDKDKNIYRKIDEFSFHCLTCNMVHALNSLTSHFSDDDHRKQYEACNIENKAIDINAQSEKLLEDSKIIDDKITKPTVTCNVKEVNNESMEKNRDQIPKPKAKSDFKEVTQKRKEKNHKEDITKSKISCNVTEGTHETTENNQDGVKKVTNVKENNGNKKEKISKTKQNNGKEVEIQESQKLFQYFYDEKAEDRILNILGCKNYITKDENDKTWCILCDWVMSPSNINAHINGKHHQTILKMHKERAEKMRDKCKKNSAREDPQKDNSKILDSLNEFQKNDINVNFESNLATCKKCSKDVAFDHDSIENHILEHKTNTANKECQPEILDAEANAVCDKHQNLIKSPVLIDHHDNQDNHDNQSKLELLNIEKDNKVKQEKIPKGYRKIVRTIGPKINKVKLLKVPTSTFVENMVAVENMMFKDVIINNKYCINILSLSFMYHLPMSNSFRCLACHMNFHCDEYDIHSNIYSHEKAVNESPVIINDNTEFIREIGPKFHCGFCNSVELSWAEMEVHLKSNSHKESKVAASWRLEQYQPSIANDQFERILRSQIATEAFFTQFF